MKKINMAEESSLSQTRLLMSRRQKPNPSLRLQRTQRINSLKCINETKLKLRRRSKTRLMDKSQLGVLFSNQRRIVTKC